MKKRFIVLVVSAIAVSLIGLVAIQLYWIRNAVAIKEVNFERGVSEAVSRAVYKFNKQELARKMMEQQGRNQMLNQLSQQMDSLNNLHYNQLFAQGSTSESHPEGSVFWQEFSFEFSEDSGGQINRFDTTFSAGHNRGSGGYLPGNNSNPVGDFFDRSRIISDLLDDLYSNQYSFQVSDRERLASLDSILNLELHSQGIKTPFEYGIYNPLHHQLVQEKTGQHSSELLQSPFAFHLFPNDIFINPEYLLLYFPGQQSYILSQMTVMMGTSMVLILVIISSFAFTIITVIRQKKLSVMKNDFINNMTHELKTPISTISLACQALRDQDVCKSANLYDNYIRVIDEENSRLELLTEKVLQTALMEKAKINLKKTGVDMHELIQAAIQNISLQVEAKHGEIHFNPKAEYSFVQADRVHMTNVVSNLLDNANKYSPTAPDISVSTDNSEKGVVIHVTDKGVGISKANQKKIFDNLYRVSTGNIHDVKGFGLGLGYAKTIVEQHGGHISVQSETLIGSRFSVFIPYGFNEKDVNH